MVSERISATPARLARETRSSRRRALVPAVVAVGVVVCLLGGPAAPPASSEPSGTSAPEVTAAPAVEAEMRTDTERPALTEVPASEAPPPPAPASDAPPAEAGGGAPRLITLAEGVAEFVLIGARYRSPSGGLGQVRVRTDGSWGGWVPLEIEPDHDVDLGTAEQGGAFVSDPVWIDHADGYELDLPGDATEVEVFLVRAAGPGVQLDRATEAMTATPSPALPAPPASAATEGTPAEPTVRLRSSWGARAYRGTPDLGPPLRRAIVHHTVNTNSYSQAQVPGLLRSIQAYHQDARGWDDIGYNFVVDRFGVVWEGRGGGIRNPVIGAHTANHNTGSVGVAYLGDATSSVSSAAVTSIGRLVGWKLFLGGTRPTNANIYGHRDLGQSSCPGQALYNSLGSVRSLARSRYDAYVGTGSFTAKSVAVAGTYIPLSGDFNGDAYSDVLWYGPGPAADRYWLGGPSGFTGRSVGVGGTYRPVTGDFNGDGRTDVFWYGPGNVADSVWYGKASGGFTSKSFTVGVEYYQPLAGDFNGDGEDDILWYGANTGRDYLWYGTTSENFTGKAVTINGEFSPFTGDFDGDQRTDVFWYGPGAERDLIWYGASNGFSGKAIAINRTFVPLVGDYTGGGTDDILWYGPGGAVDMIYRGTTSRSFTHRAVTVDGTFDAPFTGDWNADGRDDVFWYRFAGADRLWMATG